VFTLETRSTKQYFQYIFTCLILLYSGNQAVSAQVDGCNPEGIKSSFLSFHQELDTALNSELKSQEVFAKVQQVIAEAFETQEPLCAAECVFGSVGLAGKLSGGHLITQETSDSIYAFHTQSVDSADIAFFLFSAGILEFSRGDRAAARMWFDSALTIPRPLHGGDSYASTLKVRGFVNKYDSRYEDALRDFEAASEVYSTYHDDLQAKIDILAATAEVQVERGDPPAQVLETVEEAILLFEQNQKQFEAWTDSYNIYTSYARVLSGVGRYKDADEAGRKALQLVEALDDQFRIAIVHGAIAGQLIYSDRLVEARKHAMMSFKRFEEISKQSHMVSTLDQLVKIDSKLGKYKSALEFSLLRGAIRDSLHKSSQVHDIKKLQQSQAKENMQAELSVEQARGRALIAERSEARMTLGFIVAALALVVLIAIGLIYRLRARRRTHKVLESLVARRTAELSEYAKNLEEKNVELERFAFIASHDLKTPLRNITSFLNLASRRMSSSAKLEIGEYLDIAMSYAKQMNYTICDVLEFSKAQPNMVFNQTNIQLRIILDQVIKIVRPEFANQDPIISVTGNAEVFCNREDLEQVLNRLVHNALKFNESAVPILKISIQQTPDDVVEVEIQDNGIGIDDAYADQVFGLFKRLNLQETYPGTGLGLSFARKLARRMQGDVVLKSSQLGKGSVFVLKLPSVVETQRQSVTIPSDATKH